MKKILLIPTHAHKGSGGGIRIYNESLVKLFAHDKDFSVEILSILPYHSLLGIKYKFHVLESEVLRIKPDIIHINGYTTLIPKQIIKIAKKYKIKIIYTAHWHPFSTMRYPLLKKMFFWINIRPIIKYIDGIVAINHEEYDFFKRYSDNMYLIPHWLRFDITRERSKLNRIPNMILFIGNLNYKNKGFKYLHKLPQGKYSIHCVGTGDNKSLRSDMVLHTRISDQELAILLEKASLVVIPSKYEAFSYVALEALSFGTPVLMSNNVRIADYVKSINGVRIFNLGDNTEWVDKVALHIGSKVDVEKIIDLFSSKKAYLNYKNLYSI